MSGAALITAAGNIISDIIPTTTTTSGSSASKASGTTSAYTSQVADQTTTTSGTDVSVTSGGSSSVTSNTADADALASLKALATSALNNVGNSGATSELVSGIMQTAQQSLTSVYGAQQNAGLYNAASTAAASASTVASATALAASAVLGYDVQEQQVAQNALGTVVSATGVQTTNSVNSSITSNSSASISDTLETLVQTALGSNSSSTNTTSQSTTKKSSLSMICTYLYSKELLSESRYETSVHLFNKLPREAIIGYTEFATKLVKTVTSNPNSLKSKFIIWLTKARTDYITSPVLRIPNEHNIIAGWFAYWIFVLCTLYFMLKRDRKKGFEAFKLWYNLHHVYGKYINNIPDTEQEGT